MEIGGRQSNLNTADRDIALVARAMVQARARAKHALGFSLRQARGFLFFPLIPREASKRVPIFDRGTGSKTLIARAILLRADARKLHEFSRSMIHNLGRDSIL